MLVILFYVLMGLCFFAAWVFTNEPTDFLASIIFSGVANVLIAIRKKGV